jgi:putative transposase
MTCGRTLELKCSSRCTGATCSELNFLQRHNPSISYHKQELGISRSLVYRLVAKFRERPQVSSLLPSKRGRRPTSRALPIATEAVLQETIDHVYLQREKPRLSDLLKEVERECRRKGLRVPNYRTIKRRVDAIDARESVQKRSGSKAANDRFRPTSVLSTADLLPFRPH